MNVRALLFRAMLLACLAFTLPGAARGADAITVRIHEVDDSAFPVVRAVITADQDGRPLSALQTNQITATETGAPATVESVLSAVDAHTPLGLVIVLDVSGSMAGAPLATAKASAASLIQGLSTDDVAAVIAFSDTANLVQPMTTDHGALLGAIDRLQATGNTALYQAVVAAESTAAQLPVQRRAIILLTDGIDFHFGPSATREESIQAAAAGSLFYSVGFGSEIDSAYLRQIAEGTGGRFFAAPTTAALRDAFTSLETLLRSQFVVSLRSTANPDLRPRSLTIKVQTGSLVGQAEQAFASVRAVAPPPVATARAAPALPPATTPTTSHGPLLPGLAVVGLLLLGGALLVRTRYRPDHRSRITQPTVPDAPPVMPAEVETKRAPAGRLTLVLNSNAETFQMGDQPMTVGSADYCDIHLPPAPGVAPEHARVWRRDGRVMLHHVDASTRTQVNGKGVEWSPIEAEDEISIGPYVLRYELGSDLPETRTEDEQ